MKKFFLTRILFSFLLLTSSIVFCLKNTDNNFTIMIDPAGDAKNTGRQIDDTLERAVTLQFAQKLKSEIENKNL